mgnify:CR=1 FL=1
MKNFIEYVVGALVDHPDQITVAEVEGTCTTVYELRVGEGDLGKVTAKAIRVLPAAVAARQGKRAMLEILD